MLNVFVDRKKLIEIEVYAYKDEDDKLRSVSDVKEVPEGTEHTTLKFSFREPNHNDSTYLMGSTMTLDDGGVTEFKIIKLQDLACRRLLSHHSWCYQNPAR